MLVTMAVLVLLPTSAFAADVFELSENDLSRKIFIDPLFGPITGSNTTSPLTDLMSIFNGSLLVIGGILMAYTIVAGTMSTAHDGEMMGKRWSSMWLPIRTSIGVAAVLPVVGKGWCVAQVIVIWLAMQGAGLANMLWSAFIGEGDSVADSATYNPPTSLTAISEAYSSMLMGSTCVAINNAEYNSSGADAQNALGMQAYSTQIDTSDNKIAINYGKVSSFLGMNPNQCGSLTLEEEDLTAEGAVNMRGDNQTSSELLDMSKINAPVIQARRQAFIKAAKTLDDLGQKLANKEGNADELQSLVNQTMTSLLKEYSTTVTAAAKTAYSTSVNKNFLKTIKEDGWIMAGAYYMQLSKTQDLVTRAITNAPAVETPLVSDFNTSMGEALNGQKVNLGGNSPNVMAQMVETRQMLDNYDKSQLGGVTSLGTSSSSANAKSSKWVNQLVGWFVSKDSMFQTGNEAVDYNENPIIMAKGLGEKITATAWGALGSFALITAGGTGGLGSSIAPVFSALFISLLVPGATMSTYLPMLPYILWLGVVLGWAILLIEAVIAAPLWAIVHLAPDGDGVVGRGGQGYMLVLSLVLRPPLMIIGLAAAFVLMKPIGFLVNSTFLGAFALGVSPGIFGFTQALAGCIIYCVLMITIVQRVFSLIHVVPDRLLRWIGGGSGGELGQEAGALDQSSSSRLAAGLNAGNSVSHALSSAAMQGSANRGRQANEDRINKERGLSDARNSEGGLTDRRQDAEFAAMNAKNASDAGRPDEALEGQAAKAYGQMARAAESTAETQAKAHSNDPESRQFLKDLSAAREDDAATGGHEAERKFWADQTAAASNVDPSLASDLQQTLSQRGDALAKQQQHMANSGSVLAGKQEAQTREMRAQGYEQSAKGFQDTAKSLGTQSYNQAKSSAGSSVQAAEFVAGIQSTSGNAANRAEFLSSQTEKAQNAVASGNAEPFQESLVQRNENLSYANDYLQKADEVRGNGAPPAEAPEFPQEDLGMPPSSGDGLDGRTA